MFTGIVEEVGKILSLQKKRDYMLLEIRCEKVLDGTILGDSIAINGVCQTVTKLTANSFFAEALQETLTKTTFSSFRVAQDVNLERALTANRPMGGHFVQGHVNSVARVLSLRKSRDNCYLSLAIDRETERYCVKEGSITIDGMSLTIARLERGRININIIPHTWENTILKTLKTGDSVNLETDMMARMAVKQQESSLTLDKLKAWGY